MTRRERDTRRECSAVAEEFGARFTGIEVTGSGHRRIRITKGSTAVFLIVPSTPSDRRAMLNVRADARRLLRSI
jgi:hypothetical protein